MTILGGLVGALVGGPIGFVVGNELTGPETVIGTGPAPQPEEPPPPPFTGQGTSGDDIVRISKSTTLSIRGQFYDVVINGQQYRVTKEQLEATVLNLGAGNDLLLVDADVDADITARGGSGDDTLIGGKGNDRFEGGSDDDLLIGRDGNDSLKGGSGDDRVRGDAGRDDLDGGSGDNSVLHDFADFTAPIVFANPKLFLTYSDVVSPASARNTELIRK